jgi:hypothetical protein
MDIKKMIGTATLAGALGAAALGLGTGIAQADPKDRDPNPPAVDDVDVSAPPGHIGQLFGTPPGQLKKQPTITVTVDDQEVTIDNPFEGRPPGQWDDVDFPDEDEIQFLMISPRVGRR